MSLIIDDLVPDDEPAWRRLWADNNNGQISADVTAETWHRLLNPIFPIHGLAARLDGRLIGFVHYILHPVTGHIQPVCYMQDLYIDPVARRRGVAKALVQQLAALGRRESWARLYWLAEGKNAEAQALYKNLGLKLDFSLHVLPLGS